MVSGFFWSNRHGFNTLSHSALDDGHIARNKMDNLTMGGLKVYADTYKTRNWDLLHGGGALTLVHHDAGGFATFVWMESGFKMWGIVQPPGYTDAKTHLGLDLLNELFIREDWPGKFSTTWMQSWEKEGGKVYAIPAAPKTHV